MLCRASPSNPENLTAKLDNERNAREALSFRKERLHRAKSVAAGVRTDDDVQLRHPSHLNGRVHALRDSIDGVADHGISSIAF
jgi:hypothetical protein